MRCGGQDCLLPMAYLPANHWRRLRKGLPPEQLPLPDPRQGSGRLEESQGVGCAVHVSDGGGAVKTEAAIRQAEEVTVAQGQPTLHCPAGASLIGLGQVTPQACDHPRALRLLEAPLVLFRGAVG